MAKRTMGGGRMAAAHWSEGDARRVLEQWRKSGESVSAFARTIGVVPQRLFWWRRRLAADAEVTAPRFVPVVANAVQPRSASEVALVLTTRGGTRIEVRDVDASTAAWVVAVLEGTRA